MLPFQIFFFNFAVDFCLSGQFPKDIVGKNKAFAIISRLAKSLGNSIYGIKSTKIICDRWLVL